MSDYDGMEATWQGNTATIYTTCRQNKHKYNFKFSKIWGKFSKKKKLT